MISQVAVSIVGVVLESLLYGLLLILFSTNLYLRITRYARPQEFVSRGGLWWNPIVISNIAIFATCTAHWIINVERFFLAFLASAGDPLQFYNEVTKVGTTLVVFIAWRVWKTSQATAEVGGSLLMKALPYGRPGQYSSAPLFLTGSPLAFIGQDLMPLIVGLVNLLIHLRVGLGWSRVEAPDATGTPMTSNAPIFAVNLPPETNEYGLQSISQTGPTASKSGV
ncbi:hypothetical protein C8R44DRAFT_882316 [Mycena epipterygia]|nr:hypothetical protein C8R44DRAFT_882316 [Mycena epipterygia]